MFAQAHNSAHSVVHENEARAKFRKLVADKGGDPNLGSGQTLGGGLRHGSVRRPFAASKTATWADRHAARDLWDLWALSKIGAIDAADAAAARLYRRHGPTNRPPAQHVFTAPPSDAEWQAQLAGQTRHRLRARGTQGRVGGVAAGH